MQPNLAIFSLTGKTILVAGASKGIGLAIAEGLAGAGAHVIGFGRSPSVSSTLFRYVQCDILDREKYRQVVEDSVKQHGTIDGYFHVAGITAPSQETIQAAAAFEQTVNVNLTSAYFCCAEVAALMIRQRHGSIVAVTSIGATLGFPKNPGYVAAKGGLRMMAKAMALDLGPFNIRVNNLVPGYVQTEMTQQSYGDADKFSERAARTMLGRWGQPSDLVGAAIFLASSASSYMTGTDVVVDGGWTAKGL